MLEVKDLHVSYGGIRALRGVNLEVPDGKIVTLIGANGAGKSTMLRTISGLVKAESGSVTYNGKTYSVTSISSHAFHSCRSLTSITIPSSVTSIESAAFYGCTSLTAVHITDLVAWCNIMFYTGGYTNTTNPLCYAHHLYLNGQEIKDLVIPNNVTSIKDYTFCGCSSLTSITIPSSVTNL